MPKPSKAGRRRRGPPDRGPPAGAGPRTAHPGPPRTAPGTAARGRSSVSRRCSARQRIAQAWVRSTDSLLVATGVHQRGQLVEGEDHVRAELVLHLQRDLRGEAVRAAVQVRGEGDPVVVHPGQPALALGHHRVVGQAGDVHGQHLLEADAQAHHLEAAAVGVGRARPVHEPAQSPAGLDDVGARLQIQVVRVGEHRLGAQLGDRLRQHRLDRRLGAHHHERRGLDGAVRGGDLPGPTVPARRAGRRPRSRSRFPPRVTEIAPLTGLADGVSPACRSPEVRVFRRSAQHQPRTRDHPGGRGPQHVRRQQGRPAARGGQRRQLVGRRSRPPARPPAAPRRPRAAVTSASGVGRLLVQQQREVRGRDPQRPGRRCRPARPPRASTAGGTAWRPRAPCSASEPDP